MIELFNAPSGYDTGAVRVPQNVQVRKLLLNNINTVVKYYQEKLLIVNNSHILVKLINSLNVSLKRDFDNYIDIATDHAISVARVMGFVHPTFMGRVFENGNFYGKGCKELYLIDDTRPTWLTEQTAWRTLRPLRVLRHPFTDLSLGIADGDYKGSDESGVVVISINIPELMAQLRGWYQEERYHEMGDFYESVTHFVRKYPIVNMIYSHSDVCWFNRLDKLYRDQPVAPMKRCHPFQLVDCDERADDVLMRQLEILMTHRETFEQALLHLPGYATPTMLEAMALPHVLALRQNKWALTLARMPLIRFLVKLNREADNHRNVDSINRIQKYIRIVKNDNSIQAMVGKQIHDEFLNGIAEDIVPAMDYSEA